jgi:hypothetical protein
MLVQAGDGMERFAASFQEFLFSFHGDFLERFQAIGNEGGRHHQQAFLSLFHELRQDLIRVGSEPGLATQSRLEGY